VSVQETLGPYSWSEPRPSPQATTAPAFAPEPPTVPALAPGPVAAETKGGRWVAAVVAPLVVGLPAIAAAGAWRRHQRPVADSALPEGYAAEDPSDQVDGVPRVLVRSADGARFLRIVGGDFQMGDAGHEGSGEDRPAHPVVLSGYYLQETEVTNGQMEGYFKARHVPEKDRPRRWREAVAALEKAGYD